MRRRKKPEGILQIKKSECKKGLTLEPQIKHIKKENYLSITKIPYDHKNHFMKMGATLHCYMSYLLRILNLCADVCPKSFPCSTNRIDYLFSKG